MTPLSGSTPDPTPRDGSRTELPGSEYVAAEFHATYERLAPRFGYKTRDASAVPWDEVPEANRKLMIAVVSDLLERSVIA